MKFLNTLTLTTLGALASLASASLTSPPDVTAMTAAGIPTNAGIVWMSGDKNTTVCAGGRPQHNGFCPFIQPPAPDISKRQGQAQCPCWNCMRPINGFCPFVTPPGGEVTKRDVPTTNDLEAVEGSMNIIWQKIDGTDELCDGGFKKLNGLCPFVAAKVEKRMEGNERRQQAQCPCPCCTKMVNGVCPFVQLTNPCK